MIINYIVLLVLVASANSIPFSESAHYDEFRNWLIQHNKFYQSDEEFNYRFEVFQDNLKRIAELNAKSTSAKFGATEFMDLTPEEFKSTYLTLTPSHFETAIDSLYDHVSDDVPSAYDWRTSGCISEPGLQGACGSCWAFTAAEMTESAYCIATGKLYNLSQQQLVSCDYKDNGCSGGWLSNAFEYIMQQGLVNASSYPYTSGSKGQTENCISGITTPAAAKISGYSKVASDEKAMQSASFKHGPLAVAVAATGEFQYYQSGVLTECGTFANHVLQLVGWDTTDPRNPYWILKNSFGPRWGEKGFLRIRMFENLCNIASAPFYAWYAN